MSDLDETKAWMRFFGWTNDGGPGSVKLDIDDRIIGYHRDGAWQADVEKAYKLARDTREMISGQHPDPRPGCCDT